MKPFNQKVGFFFLIWEEGIIMMNYYFHSLLWLFSVEIEKYYDIIQNPGS